jgi:glutamate synthase domain-containing protein 2
MTPVVRLYWTIALILTPLSALWLFMATGTNLSWASLSSHPARFALFLITLGWTLLGGYELLFCISNLKRNYQVLANIRYLLEYIRPEIRQYLIADNTEERPFSRKRRNLIYRRAKGAADTLPFGTEQDIAAGGYRSISHSMLPTTVSEENLRVIFGGPACKIPYSASRLNISAMSFGSLSGPAIEALNKGAALGGFVHNTGEGGLSPYHLKHGGDIVWQIGTGYFGCRNPDGSFNDDAFAERAIYDVVKMIEIKLSQGAKSSHGGVLPGAKVTKEIAEIRLVPVGETVKSPCHSS